MNNMDSSRKIDDKIIYEPSMVIVGWLPVGLVVWALALLLLLCSHEIAMRLDL